MRFILKKNDGDNLQTQSNERARVKDTRKNYGCDSCVYCAGRVGRLSIDKIVKESGTSKGAFLYHFKNRKALFCALVEEYVDHLNERMNFHMSKYQDAEEPLILGYASWYEDFDKDDGGFAVLGVALLALLLHEPDALKPFHDWYAKVFKMVQDSPIKTPQLLTAIMAFEGFFFTHKMGFDSLDKETKEAT